MSRRDPSKNNSSAHNSGSQSIALPLYKGDEALIELGKIVGVWGVKGWIKLHSYTRERQGIGKYKHWILRPAGKSGIEQQLSASVETCRIQGKGVVAKLADLDDTDIALTLNGYKIFVEASQLPNLPKGEYYWYQLIGLTVVNTQGDALGKVTAMMETGANDVFSVTQHIENEKGEQERLERLIPQTDNVVIDVDLDAQQLTVEWDKDFLMS